MKTGLKPRPSCGEEAETVETTFFDRLTYRIRCKDCHFSTDFYDTREGAERTWNRRYEPPNEPLTLDELRKMDGEPVWITFINQPSAGFWDIVETCWELFHALHLKTYGALPLEKIGKTWLAYRRRPEKVQNEAV